MKISYLLALLPLVVGCGGGAATNSTTTKTTEATTNITKTPEFKNITVLNHFKHDPSSYTQGLLIHDGKLYESTGQYGSSKLLKVDIQSGKIEKEVALPAEYFGEGLALLGDKLYQLTWMEQKCFVYDINTFQKLETLSYSGEGWGITAYGDKLLMSDGSSTIRVINPRNFTVESTLEVSDNRGSVRYLNELEVIDGKLYANIYCSNLIAVIDIESGKVLEYIDCTALPHQIGNAASADVFNGIAYDGVSGRTYVTGKLWDTLFEVSF